jgi:carbon monoxide dehydrogenase subunit G
LLPEWVREIVVGLAAFVGGRSLNALGEAHKERLMMRDTMTRLTIGVESISADMHEIKTEFRLQVSALKADFHENQKLHERRMNAMEWRLDGISSRVDGIAPYIGPAMPPPPDDDE